MTAIVNNFTFPVILADDRNADVSWAHHLARGSAGGVDLAYPYGSPVLASASGVIKTLPNTGTGGNTVQLHLSDGRYIEYMHLSKFLKSTGDRVKAGDQIALSGASGNGQANAYAAHLHVHLYTPSERVNLFHLFTTTASVGDTTVITPDVPQTLNEDDMLKFRTPTKIYIASFDDAATIDQLQASAIRVADNSNDFVEVTPGQARRILDGVKDRKKARATYDAKIAGRVVTPQVIQAIDDEFDVILAGEPVQ